MFYLLLICYITIFISIILLLVCALERNKKSFTLRKHKNDEYAILIPARDESNVIQKLLESIKIQNNDMSNVYVIVEQKEDKTCDIVKKYGANIYIRKKPIKSRKGYAIDECIKEILKSKHYDLYFIFDADNVIDKNFIKIMLDYWHKGYDIATGYRNILNPFNWISGCSILMFSLINTIVNKNNIKNNKPVLLCGTGLYISGKIIDKLGGFPFNTLTEDYELSLYINANNISSTYIENAIYYDEQPVKMSSSIKQRTRWIQGFYEARKKRLKDVKNLSNKIGITPLILIVFSVICIIILSIIDIFLSNKLYINLIIIPVIIYIMLFFLTLNILIKNKNNINLSKKLMIKCLFLNPIFLLTFVFCFMKCLLSKNITWEKITHNGI